MKKKKIIKVLYPRIYTLREKLNALADPTQVVEYMNISLDTLNKILDLKTKEFEVTTKENEDLIRFTSRKLAEHYLLKVAPIDIYMLDEAIKNEHLIETYSYYYKTLQTLKAIKDNDIKVITQTQKRDIEEVYNKLKIEQIRQTHKHLNETELENKSMLAQNQLLFRRLEINKCYRISVKSKIKNDSYKIIITDEYEHYYLGKTPTGRPETVLKNNLYIKDIKVELIGGNYDRIRTNAI